jgi:hypothetical protein
MSRRIALVIAVAAGTAFVAPAAADRECFDNTCRMPEVIEAPETPPAAADKPKAVVEAAPATASAESSLSSPGSARPQMAVDALPKPPLEPLAKRPVEPAQLVRQATQPPRYYEAATEPVEVVGGRQYAAVETAPIYSPHQAQAYPGAGIVVVVPGVQYGADGVGLEQSRQDSAWKLCQTDRGERGRCTPYNYQPFGPYGYRPLGSYRTQPSGPSYVYVPGAKVITIEEVSAAPR